MAVFEIKPSERLAKLPPYTFAEIEKKIAKLREKGEDLISLSIGDPDLDPPEEVINAMKEALNISAYHKYPLGSGMKELKIEIAKWFEKRFGVMLNPEKEVLVLIGSKDGIVHLPFAILNPGDITLVPDPAYIAYHNSTVLADGIPLELPLDPDNKFLMNPFKLDKKILKNAKIIFVNYPNNPTAALAPKEYYEELVKFCKKNEIIIASDNAYSELYYDENNKPHSILEIPGAKDIAVEFHSFSKTYNMTGWRLGFVVGNEKIISLIAKYKENIDSGVFMAIQKSGIAALQLPKEKLDKNRQIFKERRDVLVNGLKKLGFKVSECNATFYIWTRTLHKMSSWEFANFLLEKYKIAVIPGAGLGKFGEGFVRFSFTLSVDEIKRGLERMKNISDDILEYMDKKNVENKKV